MIGEPGFKYAATVKKCFGAYSYSRKLLFDHTAKFKLLAFSAVTANRLEADLFEKVCIFVWLGRLAAFAK